METKNRLWLDLGKAGSLITNLTCHQDHAVGLLRTILHNAGLETMLASTRNIFSRGQLRRKFKDIDILLMSVLSFNYPFAVKCARLFKEVNPDGIVVVGGLHASVAIDEMTSVKEFDYICKGPGEQIITSLLTDPHRFERVIEGKGEKSMANWPYIDRTLWPRPALKNTLLRKCPAQLFLPAGSALGSAHFAMKALIFPTWCEGLLKWLSRNLILSTGSLGHLVPLLYTIQIFSRILHGLGNG